MELEARRGTGAFQWNRGGWFGAQLGGTLWLLLLGLLLLSQGDPAGFGPLGLALTANGVGLLLWRRRDRIAPHPGLQLLVTVCGVAAAGGIASLVLWGETPPAEGFAAGWFLLVYPSLMLVFLLQERQARRSAA